jgi:gluconate kinase
MPEFSDYIVFADESGDHGLVSIDPQFPVFALVFCLFEKERYIVEIEPAFRRLKFKYFGHDAVILHEHDIRKQSGDFSFLRNAEAREAFMADVSELVAAVPFEGYASIIDKLALKKRYADPWNPYEIAMQFCMEKISNRLVAHRQKGRFTHVLFEARGRAEDAQLELEFRRVAANQRKWGWRAVDFTRTPLEPVFVPKAANLAGHQFTDLIARPLALRTLRPDQPNRAFDIIRGGMNDIKAFP